MEARIERRETMSSFTIEKQIQFTKTGSELSSDIISDINRSSVILSSVLINDNGFQQTADRKKDDLVVPTTEEQVRRGTVIVAGSMGNEGEILAIPPSDYVSYMCVEIPGEVERSDDPVTKEKIESNILQSLGGEEELTSVFSSSNNGVTKEKQLVWRLCPADRLYSKFIPATCKSNLNGILIRVGQQELTGHKLNIKVLGIVQKKYTFKSMADFYISPFEHCRREFYTNDERMAKCETRCHFVLGQDFNIEQELKDNEAKPFFIPPPTFSRLLSPYGYAYSCDVGKKLGLDEKLESKANFDGDEMGHVNSKLESEAPSESLPCNVDGGVGKHLAQNLAKNVNNNSDTTDSDVQEITTNYNVKLKNRDSEQIMNRVVKYNGPVPTDPPLLAMKVAVDIAIQNLLEKLFEDRPLWLRSVIDEKLPEKFPKWKRKSAYAKCSYLIIDGPWRWCLCRLGYDPKNDKSSRIYQTIDFRSAYLRTVEWKTLKSSYDFKSETIDTKENLFDFYRQGNAESLKCSGDSHADYKDFSNTNFNNLTKNSSTCSDTVESKNIFNLSLTGHNNARLCALSQVYQLCEINDSGLQKIIQNAVYPDKCSRESGWFTKRTLTRIRDMMIMKYNRVLRQLTLPSNTNSHTILK